MAGDQPHEFREVTDEERRAADEALEQLHRDLAKAANRPPAPVYSPGKFTEPVGLMPDGSYQTPLTEEEKRHNEEVRQRARGEQRRARGEEE